MKKYILTVLIAAFCLTTISAVNAKTSTSNSSLASAIRLYKSGNYSQSYEAFTNIVKKDPSNIVAYYYLAITSAQIGKKDEAIENYDKVLSLSPSGQLEYYARKGKTCLQSPDKCHTMSQESETDKFIRGHFGTGFSNEFQNQYEKQKIDNLMREINRDEEIPSSKFKEYKDFSSEVPTNDEIVNAMRVLQRAGFDNMYNNSSDIYTYMLGNNSKTGLNPQIIQSLINNQLSF